MHECRESTDPRHVRRCACGREVPSLSPVALDIRQPELEREFLRGAERHAGVSNGWTYAVEDRLLAMERAKGRDSYRSLSLWKLLTEIDEEGLDLGGWPVLAVLRSYDAGLDDDVAHEFRLILQAISACGAQTHALVERARDLIR